MAWGWRSDAYFLTPDRVEFKEGRAQADFAIVAFRIESWHDFSRRDPVRGLQRRTCEMEPLFT
jgi:hypothetical protein